MNKLDHGLGVHSMWGFTPSYDLLSRIDSNDHDNDSKEEINILLVKPGDVRHIIHTLGRRHRESKGFGKKINIFVLESETEVIARHLLQLHVFFDDIPIRHRSALFLELYNALISKRTEEYIDRASTCLGTLVYGEYEGYLSGILDLSWLKQRERDDIHTVFKSWVSSSADGDDNDDMELLRDYRLRAYYGERYDCRQNVSEMDYFSKVKEVASIIHIKQWREWRMRGVAFEFGNTVYDCTNRTMLTTNEGVVKQGRDRGARKKVKGFWLDILNGPFVSYGVEIESNHALARGLFEIMNQSVKGSEQHRHHTVEVAMYNVIDYMWELETSTQYEMQIEHNIFSGLGTGIPKKGDENEEGSTVSNEDSTSQRRNENIMNALEGISIIPILGDSRTLAKKKFKDRFDHVFLSQHGAHWMGLDCFKSILRAGDHHCGSVEVETGKFVFPLDDTNESELLSKVINLAEKSGLVRCSVNKSGNGTVAFSQELR